MLFFELAVAAVSIVVWAVMLYMSFGITYPSSAKFLTGGGSFPFVLCVILIFLNILWIVDSIQTVKNQKLPNPAKKSLFTFLFGTKEQSRRLFLIMLLVVLYVFALIPLSAKIDRTYGFAVATLIYLIISIKLFGKLNWVKTLLTSAVTTGIVFFAMNNILRLPMPK